MKKLWSVAGVLFFAASSLNAAVISYWRFENNLLDSSGGGHHATGGAGFGYSTNVPGSTVNPGGLTNVASYDQGSAASTVAYSPLLNNAFSLGSFTVEAFVYLNNGASDFQQLLSNTSGNSGIYFSVGTGISGYSSGYNGSGQFSESIQGSGLDTETWYHVAWVGTYSAGNGTAVQFYVDGAAVGGLQFYAANGASHITMGTNGWNIGGPSNNFNGLFDELRISDQALTPSELLVAVPEPGTTVSLSIGLLAIAFLVARKKRKVVSLG